MPESNVPLDDSMSVTTTEQAIEYIANALTTSKLHMKTACKTLGWSFPRIRSRALTIAKRLDCTLKKVNRGVYILEPINKTPLTPTENPMASVTSNTQLIDDVPDKAEPVLLEDDNSISNV